MKQLLFALVALTSVSAFADTPQFDNLTKSDVEDVANEFAVNFSHTAVAAPETDGLWGVEVGLIGGRTSSPDLEDVVDQSGGKGSDFNPIYHAGLLLRGHFPYDLFAEVTYLPSMDISDIEVHSKTLGLGWNAGAFFNLPLDLAIGFNYSDSEVSFNQSPTGSIPVESTISLKTKSQVYWAGVSKQFSFITPYLKAGVASTNSDVDVDASAGTIFTYTSSQSESVSSSGGYLAAGANLQLLFMKLGVEASQTIGVKRVSGKFSIDF